MAARRRGWALMLAVLAAALLQGDGLSAAGASLKIGFVYVSPVGDAGWTYQHDLGRRAIERAFGDRVKTSYVESVPEGADATRVIRGLAASGHKLIFTTSFGFMNPTIKVAGEFPDVKFEHASGYKRLDNVATYLARFYEGRYLTGLVAGHMTRSNIIGYVAAFPIPEVVRGINAFTLGVRAVNPAADVRVVWTSSWYDPGREREAAEALISQRADVVTQHTDSTAPVQAAQDRGVYAIGYHSDMSAFGPRAHLTASTHNWSNYYIRRVREFLDNKWKSTNTWGGIKDGMVVLAPLNRAVPEKVRALVAEKTAAIADGRFHVFAGPITDNRGNTRVAAGKTLPDGALLKMDWFVAGVTGKLKQ